MQDYKSLRVVVAICAILVNTQTDRQTDFDWLYMISLVPANLKKQTAVIPAASLAQYK